MDNEERRYYRTEELRIDSGEAGKTTITGLAVPYGKKSSELWGFREIIAPGAFRKTLEGSTDVRADVEHDRNIKLARRKSGTLTLTDGPKGLRVAIDLPNTTVGRDTAEEVRAGLLDGMSIGMIVKGESYEGSDPNIVRTVTAADLTAVTLTQFPAYPQTAGTVALRSLAQYKDSLEPERDPDILRKRLDLAELEC